MRISNIVGIMVLSTILVLSVQASNEQPTITEVSLFKNGLGFFIAEGNLPAGSNPISITDLPRAVHGTYWFHYQPNSITFRGITASTNIETTSRSAANLAEILTANINREVELRTGNEILKGKIIKILSSDDGDNNSFNSSSLYARVTSPASPNAVIFESGGTQGVITISNIQGIRTDGELASSIPQVRSVQSLKINYSANQSAPYSISYLGRGITWAPSYEIDISKSDNAHVRLKAEVINDAADLSNIRLNFISGYPNIAFSSIDAPLTSGQALDDFLSALSGGGSQWYRRRESMITQQAMLNAAIYDAPEAVTQVYSGGYEGDLFYYGTDGITLKKGERAYYQLMEGYLPYQHIYTWKVAESEGGILRSSAESSEEVWHCIKLTNNFKEPWTTAPAIIISNNRILGQDLNYYTAPAGQTRVRITRAMEIAASCSENEVDRKINEVRIRSTSFDKVTVEGVLSIRNDKNEPVAIEITKVFEGTKIEAEETPKETKIAENIHDDNPHTKLEWILTLPAHSKKEIKYSYSVLVR